MSYSARAGWQRTDRNLETEAGAGVTAVATDPLASDEVLVATGDLRSRARRSDRVPQIWRSTDRSRTWERLGDLGAGAASTSVQQLVYGRGDARRRLAVTEQALYRSHDRGQTWNVLGEFPPAASAARCLRFHP